MAWETPNYVWRFGSDDHAASLEQFRINQNCFIRKEHKCGKIFGASKSCFIACPTDEDLEPILELMSEKLTKFGIEPIIAVKERAYGQDIFCIKICGKIIEAKFCLVILDDTMIETMAIPNPNVYYEYGLMTSLRKHIIPLQKDGLDLAFNIQSYDTVKYNSKNIGPELDRAIKDAIRITESKEPEVQKDVLSDKRIFRMLELGGLRLKDRDWFLHEAIADTNFRGLGHHEEKFYVYIAKIDEETEFQTHLEDLGVVLLRTEKEAQLLLENSKKLAKEKEEIEKKIQKFKKATIEPVKNITPWDYNLKEVLEKTEGLESKMILMNRIYIGFIIDPKLNAEKFLKRVEDLLQKFNRYLLTYNKDKEISFGNISVSLDFPAI